MNTECALISVVLATFRRNETLAATLDSFCGLNLDKEFSWELFVVDNAVEESTAALVESFVGRLPVRLLNEPRTGKNHALNSALEHVRGELVVFTDDDVLADPDWLAELWRAARRWPDAAVFGGRILPKFPIPNVPFDLTNPWVIGAFVVADWRKPEGQILPDQVYGPNMAVRRKLFLAGERFNPRIGPSGSDYAMGSEAEFVLRMARSGNVCIYVPDALVHHIIRPEQLTTQWLARRAYRYGRGDAMLSPVPNGPKIRGVPRHLYRAALGKFVDHWVARLLGRRSQAFNALNDYWFLRGRMFEYRRIHSTLQLGKEST